MLVLKCKYYVMMTGKKGKKNMPNHFEVIQVHSDKIFFFSLHPPNVENTFFATTISKMIDEL